MKADKPETVSLWLKFYRYIYRHQNHLLKSFCKLTYGQNYPSYHVLKFGNVLTNSNQTCFRVVACHNPGADDVNLEVFGLVDNMRIMICIGIEGLRFPSASCSC